VVQEMTDLMANQAASGLPSGLEGKIPSGARFKRSLMDAASSLRRAENFLLALDGHQQGGPHMRYISQPVERAVEQYRETRNALLKQALELLEPRREDLTGEEIPAPELVSQKTGGSYRFDNKAELIGMLSHLGNGFEPGSNGYKLLNGYSWKLDDLTAFLKRAHSTGLITKADWDLVQKIWDLYDTQKGAVWKAHRDMRGYYPSEITAVPFQTPWGEYKGGYAPARPDRTKTAAIDEKEQFDQLVNEDNNFAFPTTGRGATMQRVAQAAYPLEMDILNLPMHLDWTARYTTIEPVIKQVAKIVFDREFTDALARINPTSRGSLLIPWLQRTVRQSMSMGRDKSKNMLLNDGVNYLRRQTQLQALGFNPVYMAQRFAQPFVSIATGEGEGFGRSIGTAIDLMLNRGEIHKDIREESAFMRQRNITADENHMQAIRRLLENRNIGRRITDVMQDYAYIVQHATHSWLDDWQYLNARRAAEAGEIKGIDLENDQQVREYAEQRVRMTQGSFHPEHASEIEARGGLWKLGTIFYGIMNTQGNLLYDNWNQIGKSDRGMAGKGFARLYLTMMAAVLPAICAKAVSMAARGGTPQGQDPEKYWLDNLVAAPFQYLAGMVPFGGDIASVIVNKFESKHYNDSVVFGGALKDFMNTVLIDTPTDIYKAFKPGGSARKAMDDVIEDLGYALQVPVTQAQKTANYLYDVEQGKEHPTGPADFMRGVVGGPRPKE